jgi:hypothetical protein
MLGLLYLYFSSLTGQAGVIMTVALIVINLPFILHSFFVDKIKSTILVAYLTLMILNISTFSVYNIYKEYRAKNENKVAYSVGFRSWGTKVEISDITIVFYDEYGNPRKLENNVIFDTANWAKKLWTAQNKQDRFIYPPLVEIDIAKKKIVLTNCGAVLKPIVFHNKEVNNFHVEAKFRLIGMDPIYLQDTSISKYYSTQICLKVPVYGEDFSNATYLGYEYFYHDFTWSKLLIPEINYHFLSESLARKPGSEIIIDQIKTNILKSKSMETKPDSSIRLSAFLYNNYALFNIYNDDKTNSAPLFDFFIDKPFVLTKE